MRGPELEHELQVRTKIDFLHMPALVQIPEMQAPSVFRAQQDLGTKPSSTVFGVPHSLVTIVS